MTVRQESLSYDQDVDADRRRAAANAKLWRLAQGKNSTVTFFGVLCSVLGGMFLFGAIEMGSRAFSIGFGVFLICQAQLVLVRLQLFGLTQLLKGGDLGSRNYSRRVDSAD